MADESRKLSAWWRAKIDPRRHPTEWRIDDYGNLIRWADYGDRCSPYGWEIDHIHPTILGGIDSAQNTRALHWRENARHGGSISGAAEIRENLIKAIMGSPER
jgi:hypothetical protein